MSRRAAAANRSMSSASLVKIRSLGSLKATSAASITSDNPLRASNSPASLPSWQGVGMIGERGHVAATCPQPKHCLRMRSQYATSLGLPAR